MYEKCTAEQYPLAHIFRYSNKLYGFVKLLFQIIHLMIHKNISDKRIIKEHIHLLKKPSDTNIVFQELNPC